MNPGEILCTLFLTVKHSDRLEEHVWYFLSPLIVYLSSGYPHNHFVPFCTYYYIIPEVLFICDMYTMDGVWSGDIESWDRYYLVIVLDWYIKEIIGYH